MANCGQFMTILGHRPIKTKTTKILWPSMALNVLEAHGPMKTHRLFIIWTIPQRTSSDVVSPSGTCIPWNARRDVNLKMKGSHVMSTLDFAKPWCVFLGRYSPNNCHDLILKWYLPNETAVWGLFIQGWHYYPVTTLWYFNIAMENHHF